MNITLTIVALLITGLFVSCQQGSNIEDRVESEVSDLRDNLNNIAEDDENFIAELSKELEDFEGSMNDIREDINESGEQISMSARQAIDDLQGEARSLRMKLESRSGYTGTDQNATGANRPMAQDTDAVAGDRTAQMQRDTTNRDTSTVGGGLTDNEDEGPNVMEIDQELRAEFNNFRQNVNQWVDRLSVDTREN